MYVLKLEKKKGKNKNENKRERKRKEERKRKRELALVFSIGHVFLALYWMFLSEQSYFFRTANVLAKKCASSIGGWLAFGADVTAVERPPLGAAGTALGCVSSSFITMGLCRGCCAGGAPSRSRLAVTLVGMGLPSFVARSMSETLFPLSAWRMPFAIIQVKSASGCTAWT